MVTYHIIYSQKHFTVMDQPTALASQSRTVAFFVSYTLCHTPRISQKIAAIFGVILFRLEYKSRDSYSRHIEFSSKPFIPTCSLSIKFAMSIIATWSETSPYYFRTKMMSLSHQLGVGVFCIPTWSSIN